MKSKIKLIIIIAIVVAVLGGAAAYLMLTAPEEEVTEEKTEITSQLLYDKNPSDISMLTITNSYGTYAVERFGKDNVYVWTVLEYAASPVDYERIDDMIVNAATLTSQKVAAENAEDLSVYGLAEPQAVYKVEFDDTDKTVKEICIGSAVPGTSGTTYACFKGESKVFTVKNSAVQYFLEDKRECIEKTVYTAKTATDASDTTNYTKINKMTISRSDIDYDIVIEYDTRLDDEDAIVSNQSGYRMTAPVRLDLNPDKATGVLSGVFGLSAADFEVLAPTEEQLAEYGITEPSAELVFDIVGGEFKLTVGNSYNDENGVHAGWYAVADGIDVIYKFADASLPWMSFMPLDITTSIITANYIYGVTSIDMTGPDADAHFTMTGSSNSDFAVKLNGNDVDAENFKLLYQFILKAPAEQLCMEDPEGEPMLTVDIKSATGDDILEFYPTENRRTVIRLNGVTSFTCKTAYAERLLENLHRFENGEELIESW
ncbi:MAG: DUF4340 domain-containing protein [Oscillospiraceae bacterium]|nr:DUF4340 domain-containing protein [Oscillospiraceae bacterium]